MVHTLAFIILLNFPITFVVKKVNKATGEITLYCMWRSEYKIRL